MLDDSSGRIEHRPDFLAPDIASRWFDQLHAVIPWRSERRLMYERELTQLITQARQYSFDFLAWRRAFVLKKHWLVHNKGTCPRCLVLLQRAYLGKFNRRTFSCRQCQALLEGEFSED